ncbi:MAG: hypothetical protein KIT84_33485 [Labilithrix sp.]|nr:hypothetical protein [Labilithrix sp.]MCW5815961.1 hypothetical protein [Labilithrix sp.]
MPSNDVLVRSVLLAFVAVFAAFAVTVGVLSTPSPWNHPWLFAAAIAPVFVVGLTQAIVVAAGRWRDPNNVAGIVALSPLFFVAVVARGSIDFSSASVAHDMDAILTLGFAAVLFVFTCVAAWIGTGLRRAPRVALPLATAVTALAFVGAAVVPSLPGPWQPRRHHDGASITRSPVAGVVTITGEPVVAHGIHFELRRATMGSSDCEIVFWHERSPTTNSVVERACIREEPVYCDDDLRACVVSDGRWAQGASYDGGGIVLRPPDDAEVVSSRVTTSVRGAAEVLALVAAWLLFKAWRTERREHEDERPVLAASALAASAIACGLVLRVLRLL